MRKSKFTLTNIWLICSHICFTNSYTNVGSRFLRNIQKRGLIDRDENDPLVYTNLGDGYRVYYRKLSWEDALNFCAICGMNFATFENLDDAISVRDYIYNVSKFTGKPYTDGQDHAVLGLDRRYWVGLFEEEDKENIYFWAKNNDDKTKTEVDIYKDLFWPDTPDHISGTGVPEHCIGFWNPNYNLDTNKIEPSKSAKVMKHYFNDFPCGDKYYFLCYAEDLEKAKEKSDNKDECKAEEASENDEISSGKARKLGAENEGENEIAPPEIHSDEWKSDCENNALYNATTPEEREDESRLVLKWHNIFREWHGLGELQLDPALSEKAQNKADKIICSGELDSNDLEPKGRNIFKSEVKNSGDSFNASPELEGAVIQWYGEACQEKAEGEINHYTQIVWKNTALLGVGVAYNEARSEIVVVAKYDPAQNQDEYSNNYTPPRCGERTYCDNDAKELKSEVPEEVKELCPQSYLKRKRSNEFDYYSESEESTTKKPKRRRKKNKAQTNNSTV